MRLAAELLRDQARHRMEAKIDLNLRNFKAWMSAAQFLEQFDVPEGPAYPLDALAEALRAHNCRAHPGVPDWDDATDQVKTIWRERAEGVSAEIDKAIQRRPNGTHDQHRVR